MEIDSDTPQFRRAGPQPRPLSSSIPSLIPRLTSRVEKLVTFRQATLVASLGQRPNDEGPRHDKPAEAGKIPDYYQVNTEIERGQPVIGEVRYYNLAGFVNRKDAVTGGFIIEALMTTTDWVGEVEEEYKRYSTENDSPAWNKMESIPGTIVSSGAEAFGEDMRLGAVRIQSSTIISAFSEFTGFMKSPKSSILFPRPFITFRDTYEQMKTKLADMERAAVAYQTSGHSFLDLDHQDSGDPKSDSPQVDEVRYTDSHQPTTRPLQDMRCYILFVETTILPIWSSFKSRERPSPTLVEFEDLPCLFTEDDLIYVPRRGVNQFHQSAFQNVWRLRYFHAPTNFQLGQCSVYCLDYDGDSILPIWKYLGFNYFRGLKDVTALPCYPLSFHVNSTAVLEEANDSGSRFHFCTQKHLRSLFYSGWTLVAGRNGEIFRDEDGKPLATADYTESEIIVDFKEALGNYPQWNQPHQYHMPPPNPAYLPSPDSDSDSASDYDSDAKPNPGARPKSDARHGRDLLEWERQLCVDRGHKAYQNNNALKRGRRGMGIDELPKDDLALLPKRIFAYVLRERKFARLDTQGVDLNYQQGRVTLDNIQMKKGHQKIIRSSVSAHLKAQAKEKRGEGSTLNADFISGKGKGLVILLHGAPGVGKTATAEAVAIENNRPLFPISCGDLGFSPKVVEKTLRNIFRYAYLWECILLLDEADIFLTQRERGGDNLERNAIVGVFLRTLEYYSGILFLTTNRVGAVDEAFRSRVHISLWYPHLSLSDTIKILRANLERLPQWNNTKDSTRGLIKVMDKDIEEFICREYKKYSRAVQKERGPWNGRQIRNAVQVAASLALYDKESSKDEALPAILTAEHFRTVAETTKEFESFLKIAKVGDDEYLARQRQERVDDFRDHIGRDDNANKVEYTGYKPHGSPRPSQSTTRARHRRPSRSFYSEDQYDSLDEAVDNDLQTHNRRHGKAAIPRHLDEEYDTITDKGRRHHALNTASDDGGGDGGDDVSQSEEDERIGGSYRSRGGEASSSTCRIRNQEQKHGVNPADRRRRGDEHNRY
ncbi:hypothetical protein E0Z10_g9222 [Xylaria hypoxylon]|uniref:AAA+ ATPase domain-containing protein n=1 Tax=Xylaria hypoxylon TaxID=37992 RepID=A0A4Z0YSV7_9PEZI|nr:hypothetical protein E0Z10_g9222 [Xylaria hypoxylon]